MKDIFKDKHKESKIKNEKEKEKEKDNRLSPRFRVVYSQGVLDTYHIVVDTKTGVNYLFAVSGNAGGLTPLLDEKGQPVVTLDETK